MSGYFSGVPGQILRARKTKQPRARPEIVPTPKYPMKKGWLYYINKKGDICGVDLDASFQRAIKKQQQRKKKNK